MSKQQVQQLKLEIVSQEARLLSESVDSVTAQTTQGEVTILPKHIPLFTTLQRGQLTYRIQGKESFVVVSKGFLDVGPDDTVTVIADSAVEARNISEEKARAAIEAAKETMRNSQDQQELLLAEASLKKAMLELKVAQKSKKNKI